MRYRRLRTFDEFYHESRYAIILFALTSLIVPIALGVVKFSYPGLLTWTQIIVLPLAVNSVQAVGLILDAAVWSSRLKPQHRGKQPPDSGAD